MKGKWIYVAIAASLGTMAAYFNFHLAAITVNFMFLVLLYVKGKQLTIFLITAFASCFFAGLFTWTDVHNYTTLVASEMEEVVLGGEIVTIPIIDGDRLSFIFQLPSKEKLSLSYKIKTIEEKSQLQALEIGMTCKVKGDLQLPNTARNFYGFDYQKYLYYKSIHWVFNPTSLTTSQCQSSTSLKHILPKWRATQLMYINNYFPENTIGFVQALIFGDQHEMNEDVKEDYKQFGLIHLLAISGSHVGLIVAVTFFLFIRFGVTRENAFFLLFIMLPFYMVITGATPSVVRACLVTMLVLASIRFQSKFLPIDALSIVFLLMLVVNPYYILDIGFQLSFLVSFALILSSVYIISINGRSWRQLFSVTLIAQLSSFPIILYYNYEISLLSLPLNFIFVPLMAMFILPLSLLSFFASYIFEPFATILIVILANIIDWCSAFLNWIEQFSIFTFTLGKPEKWLLITYYVVVIYFFISWEKNKYIMKTKIPLLLVFLVFLYHWVSPYFSKEGEITMIDVGQGDSILIELPFRKAVYLIDTGGTNNIEEAEWKKRKKEYDVGEDTITPFLKAKGIRTINKLVLTHGDSDHIGGTFAILHHFNVKDVLIGFESTVDVKDEKETELYSFIKTKNINLHEVQSGDFWEDGDFLFYVLGPNRNEGSKNDRSVVIYSLLGGYRWLFTGDLEEKGENRLLAQYPNLKVDVLKIAHHGSKTSTTKAFIEQITPETALISVGQYNRFGHPHSAVIALLRGENVDVLRTDLHGAIRYKFIGNKGTFEWKLP